MHHRAKFNQNLSKGCIYSDLTVFIMSAVCHLGFLAVKRPILHHRTKFPKVRSNRSGDIAIFVIFRDGGRHHLGFSKIQNMTVDPVQGANLRHRAKFHQDRSNGRFFENGGRPPSWICWAPTATTHDDHFVVSIVIPNLVKIDAVVSIT